MEIMNKIMHDMLKAIDGVEIEPRSLDSYRHEPAVRCHLSGNGEPAEDYWDEDEEWQAKLSTVIDSLKDGYLSDWIDVTEEEDYDIVLKEKVLSWLENMQE